MRRKPHVPESGIFLRSRRMLARDAVDAARLMSDELPVPAGLSGELAPLLHRLIAAELVSGACVEGATTTQRPPNGERKLFAFGLSAFIDEACVGACIENPIANFALELLERCRRGESRPGLLGVRDIAKANAGSGLNLFPLMWVQRPKDKASPLGAELTTQGMRTFLNHHRGYNLKRILKEGAREQEPTFTRAGFVRLKAFGGERDAPFGERIVFEATREQALAEAHGSAISLLFLSARPQLGFTRIQQQVLQCAVDDLCDVEIANHLNISSHAVNMRWRTIYERIQQRPELAASLFGPGESRDGDGHASQKRRRVTAFVRERPEELRPYAW
ncbi:MAG: hypothetical protein ABSC22_10705 [Roseiarcus sp.]